MVKALLLPEKAIGQVADSVGLQVNAEANELPQVKIEGFPTIKMWPAGKKDAPVDYQV